MNKQSKNESLLVIKSVLNYFDLYYLTKTRIDWRFSLLLALKKFYQKSYNIGFTIKRQSFVCNDL